MKASSQHFTEAVLTTTQREVKGDLWCSPEHGATLRKWVVTRGARLGGGLRQATRLIRLMKRLDNRNDYAHFLYNTLPLLRTRFFEQEIEAAFARGRLSGFAIPLTRLTGDKKSEVLTRKGIIFCEPEMSSNEKQFDLIFSQMPLVAALLDILHNALGYGVVEDIVQGILNEPPSCHANDAARRLQSAFNAWLTQCQGSNNHHFEQARAIRTFLAERQSLKANQVNDGTLFDLWASRPNADGFKKYPSAARLGIRYMQALSAAADEIAINQASASGQDAAVMLDHFVAERFDLNAPPSANPSLTSSLEPAKEWVSPLHSLTTFPANRIKWMFKSDLDRIEYAISASETPDGVSENDNMEGGLEGGNVKRKSSRKRVPLFGDERFDVRFTHTLLRCMCFGDYQNETIQRMRDSKIKNEVKTSGNEFNKINGFYKKMCAEIDTVTGASAYILINNKVMLGLAILRMFLEDDYIQFVQRTTQSRALGDVLASVRLSLQEGQDPAAKKTLAAFNKINRLGFRKEDLGSGDIVEGIRAGSLVLHALKDEVERIHLRMDEFSSESVFLEDQEAFGRVFQEMYESDLVSNEASGSA